MIVFELWLLIVIDVCFSLPDDQQIENWGLFCRYNSKNEIYGILWLPQNIVTENTKRAQIRNLRDKIIEDISFWKINK